MTTDKPATLMDQVRELTGWHFDPGIPEQSFSSVAWFKQNWRAELKAFLQAQDSTGGMQLITLGSYSGRGRHARQEEMELWGYDPLQEFVECSSALPEFAIEIVRLTGLADPVGELLRMRPGHTLPLHADMYNTYRQRFTPTTPVRRYLVALDDWDWGHYVGIGNSVWHQWRRGQCVTWPTHLYHCASNAGRRSMLFLSVTGQEDPKALHAHNVRVFEMD